MIEQWIIMKIDHNAPKKDIRFYRHISILTMCLAMISRGYCICSRGITSIASENIQFWTETKIVFYPSQLHNFQLKYQQRENLVNK